MPLPLPITILIGDPWEFGEAMSWRLITGNIIFIGKENNSEKALVKFDQPINYSNRTYNYAVASARHNGHTISEIQNASKVISDFTGISDAQALGNNPLDVSWWRGGGLAFNGGMQSTVWHHKLRRVFLVSKK